MMRTVPPLSKFQPGEKHLTGDESVIVLDLPRQLNALLRVLLGGIKVVPLVAYSGEAKMRFAGKRQRRITRKP